MKRSVVNSQSAPRTGSWPITDPNGWKLHELWRGGQLRIRRFDCGGADPHDEEVADDWTVTIPLAGSFARQVEGEVTLADPTRAVFFDRDVPYRIAHRHGKGDCCLLISAHEGVVDELRGVLSDHLTGLVGPHSGPGRRRSSSKADLAQTPTAVRAPGLPTTRPGFGWLDLPCPLPAAAMAHQLAAVLELPGAAAGPDDPLEVEESAYRLLAALVPSRSATDSGAGGRQSGARRDGALSPRQRTAVARAHDLLNERWNEPLTLDDLGQAAAMSPFHIARLYRRATGTSLHHTQTQLRLTAALPRLLDGAADLTSLALDLGFASHSHFTTAFRRELGLAPSAYRRRPGLCRRAASRPNAARQVS